MNRVRASCRRWRSADARVSFWGRWARSFSCSALSASRSGRGLAEKPRGGSMADPNRQVSSMSCSFCAETMAADDRVASIRVLSHTRDYRYFGAHVQCLEKVMHPEIAQLIDLA